MSVREIKTEELFCDVLNKKIEESNVYCVADGYHVSKEAVDKYPCLKEERWRIPALIVSLVKHRVVAVSEQFSGFSDDEMEKLKGMVVSLGNENAEYHFFDSGNYAGSYKVERHLVAVSENKCVFTGEPAAHFLHDTWVSEKVFAALPDVFKEKKWFDLLPAHGYPWLNETVDFVGVWVLHLDANTSCLWDYVGDDPNNKFGNVQSARSEIERLAESTYHIFDNGEYVETVVTNRPGDFNNDPWRTVDLRGRDVRQGVWIIVRRNEDLFLLDRNFDTTENAETYMKYFMDGEFHVFQNAKFVKTVKHECHFLHERANYFLHGKYVCKKVFERLSEDMKSERWFKLLAATAEPLNRAKYINPWELGKYAVDQCVWVIGEDGDTVTIYDFHGNDVHNKFKSVADAHRDLANESEKSHIFENGKYVETVGEKTCFFTGKTSPGFDRRGKWVSREFYDALPADFKIDRWFDLLISVRERYQTYVFKPEELAKNYAVFSDDGIHRYRADDTTLDYLVRYLTDTYHVFKDGKFVKTVNGEDPFALARSLPGGEQFVACLLKTLQSFTENPGNFSV